MRAYHEGYCTHISINLKLTTVFTNQKVLKVYTQNLINQSYILYIASKKHYIIK